MDETLLVMIRDERILSVVSSALSGEYTLLTASSWEDGIAAVREKRRDLTAALVDLELGLRHGHDFARELTGEDPYDILPVLGVTENMGTLSDMECLDHGVADIITLDSPPPLIRRRIRSAARAKESFSFHELEKLLKELPSCIYLKDDQGRYVFNTHYWHHLREADVPGWSIRGKTDLEVRKDKANAQRAIESDQIILRTGKGMEYVIEEHADGVSEYLELVKRPIFNDDGKVTGIVGLVSDVTEKELLKLELEQQAQLDELTELLNKKTTEKMIAMNLISARKRGKSGTLMMLDVDDFKSVNDRFGHGIGDRVLAEIGRVIRNSFRGGDIAGRVGGDEFMIYLQNVSTAEAALKLAERIISDAAMAVPECPVTLSIGISFFPEHGKSFSELYKAADAALYKVKKSGKASCALYEPA